jgi:hypothetical protein
MLVPDYIVLSSLFAVMFGVDSSAVRKNAWLTNLFGVY